MSCEGFRVKKALSVQCETSNMASVEALAAIFVKTSTGVTVNVVSKPRRGRSLGRGAMFCEQLHRVVMGGLVLLH